MWTHIYFSLTNPWSCGQVAMRTRRSVHMHIIAVIAQKGGSGKSTLTNKELAQRARKPAVMDC